MKKRENLYNEKHGGDYFSLFQYMQKNQTFTRKGMMEFCINKLHLTPDKALYNVNILNSPREKSHNGSDPRGSENAHGEFYYCEPLERKWVAGIKQPQYFRLRWRTEPMEPKRRVENYVVEGEKIIERVDNGIKKVRV